jgi:hypothetical protein
MAGLRYRLRALLRNDLLASLAMAIAVAVLAAIVLVLIAGAVRTLTAPARYTTSNGLTYDAFAQQDDLQPPRTQEISALDGVDRVAGASFTFGGMIAPGEQEPDDNLLVFSGEPLALNATMVAGRPARSDREFVIDQQWFEDHGARIGQTFQLLTLTKKEAQAGGFDNEPSGPPRPVTLVGVMHSTSVDGTFVAMFPATLVSDGDVGNASTLYAIDLAPGTSRSDLRSALGGLGGTPFKVTAPEIVPEQLRTAVRVQGIGYAVFAAIAALTTSIVVGQLLSRQYRLDEVDRVVLSSLGYTRTQLVAEPLARAAPPLVVGTLLALPLAYLASGVFPRGLAKDVEAQPGLLVQPLGLFGAAAAFVLAAIVVVTISTVAGGVARPALRRVPWVDRLAPRVANVPAGLGLRFAFARTSARDRSVAPLVGLGLIAVLMLGALTFGDNLRTLIDHGELWGTNYDASVGQGGSVDEKRLASLIDGPGVADDVEAVSLYGSGSVDAGDVSLQLIVVKQLKGDLRPVLLSGRLPVGAGQIALGRVAARHLHVGVGDSLVVRGEKAKRRLEVTGLVIPNSTGGIEMDSDGGAVDPAAAAALGVQPETSVAVVRFVPGAPADTRARVARATGSQGSADAADSAPGVITNLDRVRSIPFLVGLLAAVLAVATLGHQAVMGVRRRRPDLAVLRALGLPRRRLGSIVHWQVTFAVVAVLVVAVPLGVALGTVLYRTFPDQMGAATTTEVPWATIAAAAAGLLVLANLIVVVPGRRAARATAGRAPRTG